jgi:Tfp pilus assembly protein PilF
MSIRAQMSYPIEMSTTERSFRNSEGGAGTSSRACLSNGRRGFATPASTAYGGSPREGIPPRERRRRVSVWLFVIAVPSVMCCVCAHRSPPVAVLHPRAVELQAAGAAALARGDLDRAAGQFALALEYDPRMAEAKNGLGLVALRYGDRGSAERHFRAALAVDEELAEAHLNLGGILLARGETDDALERFRSALAIDPGYAAARLAAGEALLRLGRLPEARWELAKMCEADPQNAAAHAAHAMVLARLGRVGLAETTVRRALSLDPDLPAAHRARAEILRRQGDWVAAEAELGVVIAAEGASQEGVEDRLVLGTVLAEQDRWDDAAAALSAAALMAPRHAAVQFALGYVELGRERPGAASAAARRALELRPRYPEARLLLAQSLFRSGEVQEGRVVLRQFVDEAPLEMSAEKLRAAEVLAGRLSPVAPRR